jgi:hypothetical protein
LLLLHAFDEGLGEPSPVVVDQQHGFFAKRKSLFYILFSGQATTQHMHME